MRVGTIHLSRPENERQCAHRGRRGSGGADRSGRRPHTRIRRTGYPYGQHCRQAVQENHLGVRRSHIAVLAIAGVLFFYSGKTGDRIAVGSKDFTEQIILGELLAEAIEAKTGLQVERRFDLGGTLAHKRWWR